jgi:hypothetical protein
MSKLKLSAAALAVAAGMGLRIWQVNIEPEGASGRAEALHMGDQIVVLIDGKTMKENEAMFAVGPRSTLSEITVATPEFP